MTDTREAPDLGRLSAAERKVLTLLAQGHTAKSIAGLTGLSEGAVHERLRSARRKTGVSSSRELARLLGAQENRAEKIGMSSDQPPAPFEGRQAAPRRAGLVSSKGILLMLLTFSAAAAAALLLQTTASIVPDGPTKAVDDPLIGTGLFEDQLNFRGLHEQVRSEPRADAWAARTEAALWKAYVHDASLTDGGSRVRVTCGSTLCEAAGVIPGDKARIEAAMQALQSRRLREDAERMELNSIGTRFTQEPDHPEKTVFVAYWKRAGS